MTKIIGLIFKSYEANVYIEFENEKMQKDIPWKY